MDDEWGKIRAHVGVHVCESCGEVIWVIDSENEGISCAMHGEKIDCPRYGEAQVYLDPVAYGRDALGDD